jgi:regulator of RNase E activity RraA
MVGVALPVTIDATSDPGHTGNRVHELLEAVEGAAHPVVVVCHELGPWPNRAAHIGGILGDALLARGAIGVVSDAGVRDLAELRKLGLHIFARGTVIAHANYRVCEISVPVEICGMRVEPGDVLHGDASGLVCLPSSLTAEVAQAARKVLVHEAEMRRELAARTTQTRGEQS